MSENKLHFMTRSNGETVLADGGPRVSVTYDEPAAIIPTVVDAIAAVDDRSMDDRPTLFDRVEPEAMVALFEHAAATDRDIVLEFAIDEHTVVITSEGTVSVYRGAPGLERSLE
ncbi:hypothetical protein NJ7G_4015 [Natrinema sp. J7-2]|nr:hypothetical protein NJ7G_4015 [Natrinema sp. J7-2]